MQNYKILQIIDEKCLLLLMQSQLNKNKNKFNKLIPNYILLLFRTFCQNYALKCNINSQIYLNNVPIIYKYLYDEFRHGFPKIALFCNL